MVCACNQQLLLPELITQKATPISYDSSLVALCVRAVNQEHFDLFVILFSVIHPLCGRVQLVPPLRLFPARYRGLKKNAN